jgi:ankyrin repeat protein
MVVLLNHGADIEVREAFNNHATPLHYSSANGHARATALLLDFGASTGARTCA